MAVASGAVSNDPWQKDLVVYRGSLWRAPAPLLTLGALAVLLPLLIISSWFGRFMLLFNVTLTAYRWWAARAVSLRVSAGGIERINSRLGYAVRIPWADVEGLRRTRSRGISWWTLQYAPQELVTLETSDRVSARARRAADRFGTGRRFVLDPFERNPPRSSLAKHVYLMRPDLVPVTVTSAAPSSRQ